MPISFIRIGRRSAPGLKTIDDARALRERLLSACELAERSESDEVRQRCLTPVIIGGATGFEMAGAVAELSQRPASANPTTYGSNCCSSFWPTSSVAKLSALGNDFFLQIAYSFE